MGGTFRVGRFLGVPIHADFSMVITGVLFAIAFLPALQQIDPTLGGRSYLLAAGFAALLYLSILVHEMAHAAVARGFGLPVHSITLSMLGGATALGRRPQTPLRDFTVSAAGPAATLVLAGICRVGLSVSPDGSLVRLILYQLTVANIIVGIYNLLPGLPLDGGSMLAAVLWKLTGRELTGQVGAAWVGRGVAVLTALSPFLIAWHSGSPPDTLFIVWGAVLAFMLWTGSTQALVSAKVRDKVPRLAVRGMIRPALAVPASLPLAEALRRLGEAGAGALVVTATDGQATGLVNEAAVVATPVERRPWVTVQDVARAIVPEMVLRSDLAGQDLIEALHQHPATEYLVVEPTGAIAGVLAASDIERAFADV
jgi:Zn-dependent protease/CBS domain-containing protein